MNDERPSYDLREGDMIAGKYRVEKLLGRGGMGLVVAARHIDLRVLYAIKVMLPEALRDKETTERFLREARGVARLKNPHIVTIHDYGWLDHGVPYIAMEYLEGVDLRMLAKQRGLLPPKEACMYVLQTCEGLRTAHAAGIIHRDLKTANLFLTTDFKGEPCIKILDFGIAKIMQSEDGECPEITNTRLPIGSAAYMSPEQVRSSRRVDVRTDIWALGVILYRLTAGRLPFDAATVAEQFFEILDAKPARPPSDHNPTLPPAFDALVLRCLEKDVSRRFSSVVELADALRQFCQENDSFEQAAIVTSTIVMPNRRTQTLPLSVQLEQEAMAAIPTSSGPSTRSVATYAQLPQDTNGTAVRWSTTEPNPSATTAQSSRKTKAILALAFVVTLAIGLGIGIVIRPEPQTSAPGASAASEANQHVTAPPSAPSMNDERDKPIAAEPATFNAPSSNIRSPGLVLPSKQPPEQKKPRHQTPPIAQTRAAAPQPRPTQAVPKPPAPHVHVDTEEQIKNDLDRY